jgi:glycosyltransferase involved in cell wall biosynthesis
MIGWTGTSVNFEYLYSLEDALIHVFDRYTQVNLLVVADRAPEFRKLPTSRVEFVRWTPQVDKSSVARMSIGVMPLKDSEWARGKCSYKMLCYMAAHLPVVVSPVGMNSEVLACGNIGYGASNTPEWIDSLSHLIENHSLRLAMGEAGRRVVESQFSLNQLAGQYAGVFRSATHSGAALRNPPLI